MCLAIPAQIVELQEEGMARVRVGESQTFLTASVMLCLNRRRSAIMSFSTPGSPCIP